MGSRNASSSSVPGRPTAERRRQKFKNGLYTVVVNITLAGGLMAAAGIFSLAIDGSRDEATGTVQWRRMLATTISAFDRNLTVSTNGTGNSTLRTNGSSITPANGTMARPPSSDPSSASSLDPSRYDLYNAIKVYRAGAQNVTTQASSMWVAVDFTSGATWNVTLPYFAAVEGKPSARGINFAEVIYPDPSTAGCVAVNVTSNSTRSGNVLLFDTDQPVPFSVCNGTCVKTTPLAAGVAYYIAYANNANNSYQATMSYIAYPDGHPACRAALSALSNADARSKYLRNAPGASPISGWALDLASDHVVPAGALTILAAFSNTTCLRFSSLNPMGVTSVTLALFSEDVLGSSLRRGVDTTATGFVVTNAQCSFGPNRDTSIGGCDTAAGSGLAVTSLNPATRYFLVAQNKGNQQIFFSLVHNHYSADTCQLGGRPFDQLITKGLQALIDDARTKAAAQAPSVVSAISNSIGAAVLG